MATEKTLAPRGSSAPITQTQAIYLLRTIWPQAPEVEVIKAAILCRQYNLNPLMRQVFLIPFGQGDKRQWVTVLGIKASRSIAQRKHSYSYADGPRVMTEEEQQSMFGDVDALKLWAIVRLKENGNEYPGYGFWPKDTAAYGGDKGNTPLNMAFIRAERNALDKMAPGELPDIDITDESFAVGDFKAALNAGAKEFSERVEEDIEDFWPPDEEQVNELTPKSSAAVDMLWLKESLEKIKQDHPSRYQILYRMIKGYLADRPFVTWGVAVTELTHDQAELFVKAVYRALES